MARTRSTEKTKYPGASLWLLARHDFRQPVQSLRLLAAGIEKADSEEARNRCAAGISQLSASLAAMIDGMSLIAQLETGEVVPRLGPVELADALSMTIGSLGQRAEPEHGRLLIREVAGTVLADKALLHAVLHGILLFAAKFCEQGDVTLQSRFRGDHVTLVADFRGVHPDGAIEEMAFVELPPCDRSLGKPFVGLGPALAARVALHMGGTLALDASAEDCIQVTLSLPVA